MSWNCCIFSYNAHHVCFLFILFWEVLADNLFEKLQNLHFIIKLSELLDFYFMFKSDDSKMNARSEI